MENRKKRVRRLKIIIITVLILMVLLPLIISGALLRKIGQLEERVISLEEAWEAVRAEEAPTEAAPTETALAVQTMAGENKRQESPVTVHGEGQEPEPEAQEMEQLKVYLTFDDGPGPHTEELLDILKEYEVKATFFVTAMYVPQYQECYSRILEEGHALGIHTYSHVYDDIYASVENFQADFKKMQDYVDELTGERVMISRFPGGSSNKVSAVAMDELIQWLTQEGIVYYDWNVSGKDAESNSITPQEIADNCLWGIQQCRVGGTAIVLLHDSGGKKSTMEALPLIIEGIEQMENTILLPINADTVPIQHIRITKE